MEYKILQTNIEFSKTKELVHTKVAIESSPGRFKAYWDTVPRDQISLSAIKATCRFGWKISQLSAKKSFPNLFKEYKYEGL